MARSTTLTPEERRLRARLAAHTLHARGGTNTAPARAAAEARWERQVDPDGVLDPEERRRRAEHARQAWFVGLSLKAAKARRARAPRSENTPFPAAAAETEPGAA